MLRYFKYNIICKIDTIIKNKNILTNKTYILRFDEKNQHIFVISPTQSQETLAHSKSASMIGTRTQSKNFGCTDKNISPNSSAHSFIAIE